jgi:hypothetical protein
MVRGGQSDKHDYNIKRGSSKGQSCHSWSLERYKHLRNCDYEWSDDEEERKYQGKKRYDDDKR